MQLNGWDWALVATGSTSIALFVAAARSRRHDEAAEVAAPDLPVVRARGDAGFYCRHCAGYRGRCECPLSCGSDWCDPANDTVIMNPRYQPWPRATTTVRQQPAVRLLTAPPPARAVAELPPARQPARPVPVSDRPRAVLALSSPRPSRPRARQVPRRTGWELRNGTWMPPVRDDLPEGNWLRQLLETRVAA